MRKKLEYKQTFFDTIKSNNEIYLNANKVVISDCDGVLTDGNSIYDKDGKVQKIFGAYDTEMISFMQTQGWEFQFVSRDPTGMDITKTRVNDMHCKLDVMSGQQRADLVYVLSKEPIITLFIGDSLSDIQAMSLATYAACPKNAVSECKSYVDYISSHDGGHGALGEILMWIHKELKEKTEL